MSKSQEFRLKILQKDHHEYRALKKQEVRRVDDQEFKDELLRVRRRDDDPEQRPPVHEGKQIVRRGDKG